VKIVRRLPSMKSAPFSRPGWTTYFMNIARMVATRSNCRRRQVGALIVKDTRIVSTGYNGTPRGVRNCYEGGCPRCAGASGKGASLEQCICSHAEENAIVQAAFHGISIDGAVLYSTVSPCLLCAKMIINGGLREVVYETAYAFDRQTCALLREAGVKLRRVGRAAARRKDSSR
jgi:dCMP deaminase